MDAKRLLIISSTFFPDPMVAALRVTQWCRYLPNQGWNPTVVCRHYGYDATGELLESCVNRNVSVRYIGPRRTITSEEQGIRATATRSTLSARTKQWISGFMVPDSAIRFWHQNYPELVQIAQEVRPDVILSTSPTMSVHSAGRKVSQQLGIPWVADFREADIADPRYRPVGLAAITWPLRKRFETRIYRQADLVIHQLPVHARWAKRRWPEAQKKCATLVNGFPRGMLEILPDAQRRDTTTKRVAVVGTVYPDGLLDLARAIKLQVAAGSDLKLQIIGNPPPNLAEIVAVLDDRVVAEGCMSHEQTVRQIASAAVLVNILSPHRQTGLVISTKLIEFIACGKPVIEINPTNSDRFFARPFAQVRFLQTPTVALLKSTLEHALEERHQLSLPAIQCFREEFDWETRTYLLTKMLREIVAD